jgi:hypothetical protein
MKFSQGISFQIILPDRIVPHPPMIDQCDQPRLRNLPFPLIWHRRRSTFSIFTRSCYTPSPNYSITLCCDASLGDHLWGIVLPLHVGVSTFCQHNRDGRHPFVHICLILTSDRTSQLHAVHDLSLLFTFDPAVSLPAPKQRSQKTQSCSTGPQGAR